MEECDLLDLQELYNYSSRVRRLFTNKLSELPWEELEKDRKGSFHSMKNILLHIIDNEDWIVNWVISGKSADYKRRNSEEYTNLQMIIDHLDEVEKRTRSYFENIDKDELERRVKFTISTGDTFDLSVEESLFQSFTEQLYHIGELIALLWQIGVEPPKMQWFWNNPRETNTP
ncbi:DinB family protein [[Eubacterium] cellulosolvens]